MVEQDKENAKDNDRIGEGDDRKMRATRHNGRFGKHGVYNPKHNDRKFDIANSEHIDEEREKQNIYWDCYRGYVQNPNDEMLGFYGVDPEGSSFHEIEKSYYVKCYNKVVTKVANKIY